LQLPYKLLALDLDGTLLTNEKRISEVSKEWIGRAVEAGVTVIFATGRGLPNAEAYWEELGLRSPMVLLNGAELWETPGTLAQRHLIQAENVRRMHRLAIEEEAYYWGYNTQKLISQKKWPEDAFDHDWMKFGIRHADPLALIRIKETMLGWGDLEIAFSGDNALEVSNKGITKESGVRFVCELLGIEMSEVMAVGDNGNDLALLSAAGLGVSMGTAEPEAKAAARAETDTNENDGVAKAIQKYIFGIAV
jgi:HAD superfamily hydrolase (TIGR01484 family)